MRYRAQALLFYFFPLPINITCSDKERWQVEQSVRSKFPSFIQPYLTIMFIPIIMWL